MTRRWTEADLVRLAAVYVEHGVHEAARATGRPIQSVWKKARQLGLEAPKRAVVWQRWTADEDHLLKAAFPHTTTAVIALVLNRTEYSVQGRARFLGCSASSVKALPLWATIGTERIKDGYTYRRVAATGNDAQDWKRIELIEWEQHNGPVPQGFVLRRRPFSPRVWQSLELVPVEEAFYLKGQEARKAIPPEVRELSVLKGLISKQMNRIERENGVRKQPCQPHGAPHP